MSLLLKTPLRFIFRGQNVVRLLLRKLLVTKLGAQSCEAPRTVKYALPNGGTIRIAVWRRTWEGYCGAWWKIRLEIESTNLRISCWTIKSGLGAERTRRFKSAFRLLIVPHIQNSDCTHASTAPTRRILEELQVWSIFSATCFGQEPIALIFLGRCSELSPNLGVNVGGRESGRDWERETERAHFL